MKHIVQKVMGNGVRITLNGTWKNHYDAEVVANLMKTATGVEHVVVSMGRNFLGAYDEIEEECTRA